MLREESQRLWASATPGGEAATDEALAALAARGDVEAFIALYKEYLQPVYAYLYSRVGNRSEAEDLASTTFERSLTSISGYRPTGSFRGWIFTIAARALADHLRRRGPTQVDMQHVASTFADPASGPEEAAIESEEVREVLQTIASLGQEQQEVVALRFIGELRYGEIAGIVGKSEAAVKMIAYRALAEIKRRHSDARG